MARQAFLGFVVQFVASRAGKRLFRFAPLKLLAIEPLGRLVLRSPGFAQGVLAHRGKQVDHRSNRSRVGVLIPTLGLHFFRVFADLDNRLALS